VVCAPAAAASAISLFTIQYFSSFLPITTAGDRYNVFSFLSLLPMAKLENYRFAGMVSRLYTGIMQVVACALQPAREFIILLVRSVDRIG